MGVNIFVSIDADKRRQYGNGEDTYLLGNHSSAQRVYQLATYYYIDCGPTNASRNIEKHHHHRTDPTEREARNGHLTETEFGAECREESNRERSEHIKNNDGNHTVPESKCENVRGKRPQYNGREHQVGGEPHCEVIEDANVCACPRLDTFNTLCLNASFNFWNGSGIRYHY